MSSADIHRPRAVGTLAVVCLLAAGPLQAQSGFLPNDPDSWTVAGTADHQEGGGEPLRGCERGVHRLPERGVLQDESTAGRRTKKSGTVFSSSDALQRRFPRYISRDADSIHIHENQLPRLSAQSPAAWREEPYPKPPEIVVPASSVSARSF